MKFSNLKSYLDEAKFEKGKLEELLHSVTEECEELKAQKAMLTDRVSDIQETLNNGEEEKRSRKAMQAKLVRLESNLSAFEASHVHEAELKNDLSKIKRSNSEYRRKIQSLEQENEDLTRRTQLMEKGLLQISHINEENLRKQEIGGSPVNEEASIQSKIQLLETKLAEALEENKMYRARQKSPMPEGQSAGGDGKDGKIESTANGALDTLSGFLYGCLLLSSFCKKNVLSFAASATALQNLYINIILPPIALAFSRTAIWSF